LNNNNTIINYKNNGNVGIGTNNPIKKLQVTEISSDGPIDPPIEKGGSIRLEHIYTGGTNSVWDIEPVAISLPNQIPKFNIGTPNSPKFSISANGKIGIGTTNPTEMLDIMSLHEPVWIKLKNSYGSINIGFNGTHGSINSSASLLLNWYTGNDVVVGGGGVGTDPNGVILWDLPATGNLIARYNTFLATDGGKVYIGTSEESASNSIYKLFVDGGVMTRDVFVTDLHPFPDYVFGPKYNLPELGELREFIKTNGHLPEVPSAEEVEANNGFALGEMNILLLKKIEELTLYILKQDEDIQALKKEIKKSN
jgi:hypothetical protein